MMPFDTASVGLLAEHPFDISMDATRSDKNWVLVNLVYKLGNFCNTSL